MTMTLSSNTLAGAGTHFIYSKLVLHRKNNSGLHFPIIDFYEKQTKRHYKALKQFNWPSVDLTGNKLQIIKSTTHIHKIQNTKILYCKTLRIPLENSVSEVANYI